MILFCLFFVRLLYQFLNGIIVFFAWLFLCDLANSLKVSNFKGKRDSFSTALCKKIFFGVFIRSLKKESLLSRDNIHPNNSA